MYLYVFFFPGNLFIESDNLKLFTTAWCCTCITWNGTLYHGDLESQKGFEIDKKTSSHDRFTRMLMD